MPHTQFYAFLLAGTGGLALLVAWLPLMIERLPISLPILCVGLGAAVFSIPGVPPLLNPLARNVESEHLTELVVLISLMGAGLKLDRRLSLRGWTVTWRLIFVTMPLSIGALALLGWSILGMGFGTALLLAAALAPTDPVLAGDVQVGPPGAKETDEVRFSLTSEAGLNDAAAFPFVLLAIGIVGPGTTWIWHWVWHDVLLRTAIGSAIGLGAGWLLGLLAFRMPKVAQLSRSNEGFVSLAATLFVYGICEIVGGYGFVAVFLTGITFRHSARRHEYHQTLHDFTESIEHVLTMVVLLLLGGALVNGLLSALGWADIAYAVAAVALIRPAAGLLGLAGLRHHGTGRAWAWDERLVIAGFGIRGIGSIYYLVYALNRHGWAQPARLQAIIGLVVLLSILVHGASVTPVMRWLDHRRKSRPLCHMSDPA